MIISRRRLVLWRKKMSAPLLAYVVKFNTTEILSVRRTIRYEREPYFSIYGLTVGLMDGRKSLETIAGDPFQENGKKKHCTFIVRNTIG